MSDEDDARERARAVIYDALSAAARRARAGGADADELVRQAERRIEALRSAPDAPSARCTEDVADGPDEPR